MTAPSTEGRRPLKTRSWTIFQTLAAWLASRGVSPNAISAASVVFATLGAAGFVATDHASHEWTVRAAWIVAAAGIQLRLIANLLDGMVAVEGGRASATGPLFNEVPDRLSDPILLIAAGYSATGSELAGWAAALAAVLVAYARAIGASVGAGQIFAGPMAKPQRMAILTLLCIAGALLPTDWMRFDLSSITNNRIASLGAMELALWVIVAGCLVTFVRRLRIASDTLRSNFGVKESL